MTLTVSQLNSYVQRSLQGDPLLRDVEVSGEISNVSIYAGSMIFFTLKDEQAAISCAVFGETTERLPVMPFEGMRALVRGSVSLYVKSGQYRLAVRSLKTAGIGPLYEQLQRTKARLEREGLFAQENKIAIPGTIDTLGVVSSPIGAVIHDIIHVSTRRDPQVRILLCPAKVQVIGAAEEVVRAIRILDRIPSVSVIVVARGGGSLEDLWTFNEEIVVRAVAQCRKPVISAVGHETDVTLCDLAADLRAPTPSAAAECAVPVREELLANLAEAQEALKRSLSGLILQKETALKLLDAKLEQKSPAMRLKNDQMRLEKASGSLQKAISARFFSAEENLRVRQHLLELVSPYKVLERGYVIAERDGRPLVSVRQVHEQEEIRIRFADGEATAVITSVKGKAST